jgi:hypothetical protein
VLIDDEPRVLGFLVWLANTLVESLVSTPLNTPAATPVSAPVNTVVTANVQAVFHASVSTTGRTSSFIRSPSFL